MNNRGCYIYSENQKVTAAISSNFLDYNPCVNDKDKNNQNSTQVKHHIKHNVVSLSQKN